MKKIVAILMAMFLVMSVTVVFAGGVADKDTKVPVIVGFKDKPSQADKDMIRGCGGDIKHSYTIINAIAAKLPEQAIEKIEKNTKVAYVEMDAEVHALEETLPWGVDRIDAEIVHANNKGTGVKVAIIDSGIDKDHPDLQANIEGGINFVSSHPRRPADPDNWDDDYGHGTHCAGIVAAVDNDEGVIGVAPEADLYGVKVLDRTGRGYVSDVIAGIEWSIDNRMQVISMSLGGGGLDSLETACDNAFAAEIVLVAAAGNDDGGSVIYPAAYGSVIAVSAIDISDNVASFSNIGPEVELAAPGVDILSTYLGGGYATASGTSMACPHVAGTAALVIASGITDNDEVRTRLQETADDLGEEGKDNQYGYGLVDADEAASGEDTTPPAISVLTPADGAFVNNDAPTISATVTDVSGIDPDSIVMSVDGAAVSHTYDSGTGIVSNTTTTLAEGSHTVALEVNDTKGNLASESWSFTVDITPPSTITDLAANTGEYPDISLEWTSVTDSPGVSYYNIYRNIDSTIDKANDLLDTTTATSYTDSTGDAETTYYYAVCAVDSAGNEAVLSNIAEATVASAPDNTMYVASIEMETGSRSVGRDGRNTFVWAVATVTIFDAYEKPVEGATVSGNWSGLTSATDSRTTDADGQVAFDSDPVKNAAGTFTFTVDGVTHAVLDWDGVAEHAIGSITV